jgi:predicted nucleic acid-binding Zn ribbon protein
MVNASEVKAKLDTHEAVCSERWKETILRIKRIEHIMIVTAGTMIVMMIGLLVR